MGDRVQALIEGIAQKLYYRGKTTDTCNLDYIPKWSEVPAIIKEAYRKEAKDFVSFLASQGLGWAEKLELLSVSFMSDSPIYEQAFAKGIAKGYSNMIDKGAKKFVPLEIK